MRLPPNSRFTRIAYLKDVPPAHRAVAAKLCDALERTFGRGAASLYSGFPMVIRDGEWLGGFAIRSTGPVAYCCSPTALATHRKALAPFMKGRSCIAVKAIPPGRSAVLPDGATLDEVLALVERAWRTAKSSGGMISSADRRRHGREQRPAQRAPRPSARRPGKSRRPGV